MEVKSAIIGQFLAGLAMLRKCIEVCPASLWEAAPTGFPRTTWRIAYHVLHGTHRYVMQTEADFVPWDRHVWHAEVLWDDDERGMPPAVNLFSQADLIDYLDFIAESIPNWINALDLESQESGFSWHKMRKLDHVLMSLRHLGTHTGQIQEQLYALGLEPGWISRNQ
jgi:hypothetical protein